MLAKKKKKVLLTAFSDCVDHYNSQNTETSQICHLLNNLPLTKRGGQQKHSESSSDNCLKKKKQQDLTSLHEKL